MASVDFDGTGDYYSYTGILTTDTAWTMGLWFNVDALPGSGQEVIFEIGESSGAPHGVSIGINSGGNLVIGDFYTPATTAGSASISTGTWYYIWVTKAAGNSAEVNIYVGAAGASVGTTADATRTQYTFSTDNVDLRFGGGSQNTNTTFGDFDGKIKNPKMWDALVAVTANADAEKVTCDHQATTNAYSEWLLGDTTETTDEGPGSRNLTANGNPSNDAGANPTGWSCGGGGGGGIVILRRRQQGY